MRSDKNKDRYEKYLSLFLFLFNRIDKGHRPCYNYIQFNKIKILLNWREEEIEHLILYMCNWRLLYGRFKALYRYSP